MVQQQSNQMLKKQDLLVLTNHPFQTILPILFSYLGLIF